MSEQNQQNLASQNVVTFFIATTVFALLYIHLQVIWFIFLAFGVLGYFAMIKEKDNMEEEHKVRYRIFIAAMAASSLVGIAWQAL